MSLSNKANARSMNGLITLSDGVATIEGGAFTFADGSMLNSMNDVALKSDSNTFTANNTFTNDTTFGSSITCNNLTAGGVSTGVCSVSQLACSGDGAVDGTFTTSACISDTAVVIPNVFTGPGYVSQGVSAYEGMYQGNGDGASESVQNLKIKSWNGIGFIYSGIIANPSQTASIYMDVRAGTFTNNYTVIKQTLSVGGVTSITNTTATSAYNNGALVVNGGIGVSGKVISNSEIQASSFYTPSGTLTVGGISYLNGGINVSDRTKSIYFGDASKGLQYSGVNTGVYFGTSSFPNDGVALTGWADGCLGTVAGGNKTVLGWNNSGCVGINTNPSTSTSSTSTTTGSLVVAGGVGIAGSVNIGANLKISGYMIPIYDSGWFAVVTNASYIKGGTAGFNFNIDTPYTTRVYFSPTGSGFRYYEISGQNMNSGHADGYGLSWLSSTGVFIRTGVSTVCKYHDGTNYISATSGYYRIFVYA